MSSLKNCQPNWVVGKSPNNNHSIFVGLDQGYYADEGIELDIVYTDWPGANELGAADQVEIWTKLVGSLSKLNLFN